MNSDRGNRCGLPSPPQVGCPKLGCSLSRIVVSGANPSPSEGKLAYVRRLNTPTPCLPRSAVPISQGRCRRLFHSQRPDRLRSGMRLPPLCLPALSHRAVSSRKHCCDAVGCAYLGGRRGAALEDDRPLRRHGHAAKARRVEELKP
jgi:hypothetical protein